jgi:hypothetical protein
VHLLGRQREALPVDDGDEGAQQLEVQRPHHR